MASVYNVPIQLPSDIRLRPGALEAVLSGKVFRSAVVARRNDDAHSAGELDGHSEREAYGEVRRLQFRCDVVGDLN